MSETVALSGTVEDVFGHRFTLKTLDGKHLVDLGPDAEHIVEAGQQIDLKGDRKPSEIRARSIRVGQAVWQDLTGAGKQPPHGSRSSQGDRKHDGDKTDGHGQDDGPAIADDQVTSMLNGAGYTDHGARTRKPRHVEVTATKNGKRHVVHVHKDGVKKAETVD